ncbi:hypothetical protein JCM10213v2_002839 [Rhodosporidiobolus nylandii]
MRLSGANRAHLARRPLGRPASSTYTTLARSRPSPPPRLSIHPSLLLLHFGSVTAASCLIPVIGARYASARAEAAEQPQPPSAADPPVPFDYPIQHPYPPRHQVLSLSSSIRRQVASSPLDAAFNLRQLNLVAQPPQLHLPDQSSLHPPSLDLSTLEPERWVWRLPAAAALHAILRVLRDPQSSSNPRLRETLLPIALTIAQHAVRFDSLMWAAVVTGRQPALLLEWERLLAKEQGSTVGEGLQEEPHAFTRLKKRPRTRTAHPDAATWEKGYRDLASQVAGDQPMYPERKRFAGQVRRMAVPAGGPRKVRAYEPLPPHLQPAVSLPTRTLDSLFLHIVETPSLSPSEASAALALSISLSNLRRRRTHRALTASFQLAMRHDRPDLAARFWADYVGQLEPNASKATLRHLDGLFRQLSLVLRPVQRGFEAAPGREVQAAVATLARLLDERWAAIVDAPEGKRVRHAPLVGDVIRLIATFPPAPHANDFPPGSALRQQARKQSVVARMVKTTLKRVIEEVVQRDVEVESNKVVVGAPWTQEHPDALPLPLTLREYNTLISFSLLKLQSPELALLVLERMADNGVEPSAATHNILYGVLELTGGRRTTFRDLLAQSLKNEHTLPVFLTLMARTGNYDDLERVVFHLLPELDQTPSPTDLSDFDRGVPFSRPITPSLPPARPPPSSGRSPYIYTALLNALVRAGRVGLAERVFRNARWAAELSREPSPGAAAKREPARDGEFKKRRGWALPQHAYTLMLQMYAAEVVRGQQLERRTTPPQASPGTPHPPSSPYVRGWGRHALRVFLLRERRVRLQNQLGTPASYADASLASTSRVAAARHVTARSLDLPHFLRAEAAPIVAIWELEGGSKGPELESLQRAMASPQAQGALRVLFPGRAESQDGNAQKQLSDLAKARWRKGQRAPRDAAAERVRARGDVLRRRELVKKVKAEKEIAKEELEGGA